ncbi:hypothetical protein EPD60_01355 [Flaviaesturariibacter flavus]|uniref:Uncharacterized protein n=1 Tax=Flaviaesturariibacter flavus TaxID=2502780 RepID=A0A4V6NB40_9BACT|nr:hypothetical protein [Flaviaesturariibacter flavus]TCJ19092.1 hypothetical protein EPD60_01355 [Flaviaesturariibacter flavus]
MPETDHHENELLRRLELEYTEKVAAGASHDELRPLRSLVTRIRTRLEMHTVMVPVDLQTHPALQRLRKKFRKETGRV